MISTMTKSCFKTLRLLFCSAILFFHYPPPCQTTPSHIFLSAFFETQSFLKLQTWHFGEGQFTLLVLHTSLHLSCCHFMRENSWREKKENSSQGERKKICGRNNEASAELEGNIKNPHAHFNNGTYQTLKAIKCFCLSKLFR